ncbi:D-2-hydroxyacid dehydrogenase [Maribacter sp. 2307ULW6-5]|uniref:D-2-hydroxyacid dehydrogenase n=1 Tax=Maribacter sp. 2307ULW6-5 TaxID=3386275 RepID=UPI0039BC58EF
MAATKILANDGISPKGEALLNNAGFEVLVTRVAQEQLAHFINEQNITVLLVRSATTVNKALMDACPSLRLIGRGGVGMDNIDVAHAQSKGLHVINTPGASAQSVAELVFAHLFAGARQLQDANRAMPLEGDTRFKQLKKAYGAGTELRGKTLGIIGFGKIGQETAKMALALGMRVLYHDTDVQHKELALSFFDGRTLSFSLQGSSKETVLRESDFISLHTPGQEKPIMAKEELQMMKDGAAIVNTSRGGVLDEVALVDALESGKISFAGLDVFESEPSPEIRILMHPQISLSPHIGAGTREAQERIGLELSEQIISLLK